MLTNATAEIFINNYGHMFIMKIAVTGGKGGTGKSTVATSLAVELGKRKKVMLFDADVDCPNDYTILSIDRKRIKIVKQMIPRWDLKKCKKCGSCSEVCRYNAIVQIKGKYPIFVPDQCNGCGACIIACPVKAIGRSSKKIGNLYEGSNMGIDMIMGELLQGQPLSEFVVSEAKGIVESREKDYDFIITDTSAGTHCDVISALLGNDLALAVTEPTPLGAHDLELILKLLHILKIPGKIVLNKSDVGNPKLIERVAKKFKTGIVAEIPYSKSILECYSKGIPIKDRNIEEIAEWLEGCQAGDFK
jgi:MinD superfamily P-loop ATPase